MKLSTGCLQSPLASLLARGRPNRYRSLMIRWPFALSAAVAVVVVACADVTPPVAAQPGRNRDTARVPGDIDPGFATPMPPPVPPHHCPVLANDSPLRALESKEVLEGCPSDVQLRPGDYGNYSVLFTCPGALHPMIVVDGHGATVFPKPVDINHQYDQQVIELEKVRTAGQYFDSTYYFGRPSGQVPPCATRPYGMALAVSDYTKIDQAVEGLVRFILHDDLDVEFVIFVRPKYASLTE